MPSLTPTTMWGAQLIGGLGDPVVASVQNVAFGVDDVLFEGVED